MTDDTAPQPRLSRPGARLRQPLRDPYSEARQPREGRLTRRRRTQNDFDIDVSRIPEGMSWEWKCKSCYGQPNTEHMTGLRENHWKPVMGSAVPDMVPEGYDGPVERRGMALMQRPSYLTDEARDEDYQIARGEVAKKESQLGATPPGTMTRAHPSARNAMVLRKSNVPLVVEEEE